MIAQIIPYLNLPKNIKTEIFSYIIPSKLEGIIKIGQIVEIEFRNKKTQGLVVETIENNQEDNKKLKEIIKILPSEFIATKDQIDIINHISENYFTSKALAFKTVLSELPKNKSSR